MGDAGTATRKARAEVENVVDEVVQTILNGVTRRDGSEGFDPAEAERLRARLQTFAGTIIDAARGPDAAGTNAGTTAPSRAGAGAPSDDRAGAPIDAAIDAVVETIRDGVIHPAGSGGFGPGQADELRAHFRLLADAMVAAARKGSRSRVDAAIGPVVKTLRSGFFRVYGRASYAAITADQLGAYLETFADAVLTVVEKER